ncbi:MAG TPA: porin family protein, partial [Flavitalea sp.]|nr:porin family protein [Flavitalea sp.]
FAEVSKASDINTSSQSGFNGGIFFEAPTKKFLGFRSELSYSKQGYNYKTSENTGNVNLDYFLQTQLLTLNFTKLVQLHAGFQTAFLLNATVDSIKTGGTPTTMDVMDLYNKFDYGFAFGGEVHPFKGLLVGARYNLSLAKLYKDLSTLQAPSFTSEDAKNNVFMIYAGWKFGGFKPKEGSAPGM